VKKCLGLWVDNSEKVLEIALMNKNYFPCVPVSEHEAFKEKVRKATVKHRQRVNQNAALTGFFVVFKEALKSQGRTEKEAEEVIQDFKHEFSSEFKQYEKELGLSSKQEKKAGELK